MQLTTSYPEFGWVQCESRSTDLCICAFQEPERPRQSGRDVLVRQGQPTATGLRLRTLLAGCWNDRDLVADGEETDASKGPPYGCRAGPTSGSARPDGDRPPPPLRLQRYCSGRLVADRVERRWSPTSLAVRPPVVPCHLSRRVRQVESSPAGCPPSAIGRGRGA